MNRSAKHIVFLILIISITALILVSCGQPIILPRPSQDEGVTPFEPTGKIDYTLENGVLTVSCETDIMDGAIITVTVDGTDGTNYETVTLTKSGNIEQSFTVSENWPDSIIASVICTSKNQPDSVLEAYGKNFQNLSGDNVLWNTDGCFFGVQTDIISVR